MNGWQVVMCALRRKIKIAMNKVVEEGNVPKDHRPIALTNVGYKIFMSLVKD